MCAGDLKKIFRFGVLIIPTDIVGVPVIKSYIIRLDGLFLINGDRYVVYILGMLECCVATV